MAGKGTNKLELAAASFIANGGCIQKAAAASGISEPTYYRYQKNPEFQRILRDAKQQVTDGAVALLLSAIDGAIRVLIEIANDKTQLASARVAAAGKLISFNFEYSMHAELVDKVALLEARNVTIESALDQEPEDGREWVSRVGEYESDVTQ
jgi:uncharacterized protein YaiL (DUF2058 family)